MGLSFVCLFCIQPSLGAPLGLYRMTLYSALTMWSNLCCYLLYYTYLQMFAFIVVFIIELSLLASMIKCWGIFVLFTENRCPSAVMNHLAHTFRSILRSQVSLVFDGSSSTGCRTIHVGPFSALESNTLYTSQILYSLFQESNILQIISVCVQCFHITKRNIHNSDPQIKTSLIGLYGFRLLFFIVHCHALNKP